MTRILLLTFYLLVSSNFVQALSCIDPDALKPERDKALASCLTKDQEYASKSVIVHEQYALGYHCLQVERDDIGLKWLSVAAENGYPQA